MINIFKACSAGNLELVKQLITRNGFDVRHYSVRWASAYGHLEIVKYLVSQGANVCYNNNIAVRYAAVNGHLEVVKYLVSQGANVRANNDYAIRFASQFGHLEIVKYLVSQGADICINTVCNVSERGNLELIKYFVSQGLDIKANDNIAIRSASAYGHLEFIKYLVSQGADVRAANDDVIITASLNGHLEVVKYLVSQGAPTTNLSQKALSYLSFCKNIQEKTRIKAQKKIYFWWIPICYDLYHPSGCGQRMAQLNLNLTCYNLVITFFYIHQHFFVPFFDRTFLTSHSKWGSTSNK